MAVLWHGDPLGNPATPGSQRARSAGCTCSPYINQSGRGTMSCLKDLQGRPLFSVAGNCPIHAATTDVGSMTNPATVTPLPPNANQG